MKYRQCRLCKSQASGVVETTVFVPEEYAVVGKILQLKQDGTWIDGWEVMSAGELVGGKFVENQAHNSNAIWKPSAALTSRGNK